METLNQVLNPVQLIKMKLNLSVYIHKAETTMKLRNKMLIFQISQICFLSYKFFIFLHRDSQPLLSPQEDGAHV